MQNLSDVFRNISMHSLIMQPKNTQYLFPYMEPESGATLGKVP